MGTISTLNILVITILSCSQARAYKLAMNPDNRDMTDRSYDATYHGNDVFAPDNDGIYGGKNDFSHNYNTINGHNDDFGRDNDRFYDRFNDFGRDNDMFNSHNNNFDRDNGRSIINSRYVDYDPPNNMIKSLNNDVNGNKVDYVSLLNNIIKIRNFGRYNDILDSNKNEYSHGDITKARNEDFGHRNGIINGQNYYIGRNKNDNDNEDSYKGNDDYLSGNDNYDNETENSDGDRSIENKCKEALLAIMAALQQEQQISGSPFMNLFAFKGNRKNRVQWKKWLGWNKSNGYIVT